MNNSAEIDSLTWMCQQQIESLQHKLRHAKSLSRRIRYGRQLREVRAKLLAHTLRKP